MSLRRGEEKGKKWRAWNHRVDSELLRAEGEPWLSRLSLPWANRCSRYILFGPHSLSDNWIWLLQATSSFLSADLVLECPFTGFPLDAPDTETSVLPPSFPESLPVFCFNNGSDPIFRSLLFRIWLCMSRGNPKQATLGHVTYACGKDGKSNWQLQNWSILETF